MTQIGTFFKWSLLWLWLTTHTVLFAPFYMGAAVEQGISIWCALVPLHELAHLRSESLACQDLVADSSCRADWSDLPGCAKV